MTAVELVGGYYYVIDDDCFASKECFAKQNNFYFSTQGMVSEMTNVDLPRVQQRLYYKEESFP